jgi:hypothetical protein
MCDVSSGLVATGRRLHVTYTSLRQSGQTHNAEVRFTIALYLNVARLNPLFIIEFLKYSNLENVASILFLFRFALFFLNFTRLRLNVGTRL